MFVVVSGCPRSVVIPLGSHLCLPSWNYTWAVDALPFLRQQKGDAASEARRRGFTATQQQTRRVVSRNDPAKPPCIPPCTSRRRDSASPAHIATLVRAPLRFAKGAYVFPLLLFPASPCHSEHSHVIPSAARNLPPSRSARGQGDAHSSTTANASPAHIAPLVRAPFRKRRGRGWRKIMAIIPPSWQSWFKISPLRKA